MELMKVGWYERYKSRCVILPQGIESLQKDNSRLFCQVEKLSSFQEDERLLTWRNSARRRVEVVGFRKTANVQS